MPKGRPKAELVLSQAEMEQLNSIVRSRSLAAALVTRARIVLAAAAGEPNSAIARRMHLTGATAGKWRRRFIERIDDPDKNWKFSTADIEQRKAWDDYMKAYAQCLEATSTRTAPWYVVPADDKKNARLIISQTIQDALGELQLSYPAVSAKQRKILQSIRRKLAAEEEGDRC